MSRVWDLEAAVRVLDPEALTFPDGRGGAAFLYHHDGRRYRLTLTAGAIVRNTLEADGTRAPFPPALALPVWAFRGRDAEASA